jgi:hypothetical protein
VKRAIPLLVKILKAVLRTQLIPPTLKHARGISFKPGKDTALLSSNHHISVLDTADKLFEYILLARLIREVSWCVLLRDEQFGFRYKHSKSVQSIPKKSVACAFFLDVTNAFDSVWIGGNLLFVKDQILECGDERGIRS